MLFRINNLQESLWMENKDKPKQGLKAPHKHKHSLMHISCIT